MEIEAIKNRRQLIVRTISILTYQLAIATPDEAVKISKELRYWKKRIPNQGFRSHHK